MCYQICIPRFCFITLSACADVQIQVQNPRHGVFRKTLPSAEDMDALSKKCEKLSVLKADVLKTTTFGSVEWEKKDGKWTGGVTEGKGVAAQPS